MALFQIFGLFLLPHQVIKTFPEVIQNPFKSDACWLPDDLSLLLYFRKLPQKQILKVCRKNIEIVNLLY